jgi:hypothetical protein
MPPKHGTVADVSATISGVAQDTDYDRTGEGLSPFLKHRAKYTHQDKEGAERFPYM